MDYNQFLASKAAVDVPTGFEPSGVTLRRPLFDFQNDVVRWAVRRGRAALFEDCGLGKTMQQLVWAQEIASETNGLVLILAPLAVADQTVTEGERIGIEVTHVGCQADVEFHAAAGRRIFITNYEKLHRFDASKFIAVVLDESSILKSYDGATRTAIIESFRRTPYKLACTATPAPNDYMELGNHAEFLGVMSREEMLAMFFTHDGGDTSKWRLKGHAESEFWRWLCSWAVNIRKPSDLGYDDGAFQLPPLNLHEHIVESNQKMDGFLFALPASSLAERREARKASLPERVALAINIIDESWAGNLNTKRTEGENTATIRNGEPGKSNMPGRRKKTKPTCENTTSPTGQSSEEPESSKKRSIKDGEKNTLPTQLTETNKSDSSKLTGSQIQELGSNSASENTDSHSRSMTHCSPLREESAPSADVLTSPAQLISHSSITATQLEGSGESCAPTVITDSESSKTIQTSSSKPTNTSSHLAQWIVWCNLDSEQRALENSLGSLAFSIYGSLKDHEKENRLARWLRGERPILIGKPSMMGYGLNLQQCFNVVFVGLSDSYEQFYQAVRRCWRFGQKRPVEAHLVISSLEGAVLANLKRKEADAARMAEQMVKHMAEISSQNIRGMVRNQTQYEPKQILKLPEWIAA